MLNEKRWINEGVIRDTQTRMFYGFEKRFSNLTGLGIAIRDSILITIRKESLEKNQY